MRSYLFNLITAAVMVLTASGTANCQVGRAEPEMATYHSSQGFTIGYPSNWTVQSQVAKENLVNQVKKVEKVANFDSGRMDVVILDPSGFTFHRNVNVVVNDGSLDITDAHKADLESLVHRATEAFNTEPVNLKVTIETIAGMQAMVARYQWTLNNQQISQVMVVISGASRSYDITCTGQAAQEAADASLFARIANSFTLVDDAGKPISGGGATPFSGKVATGAITGAVTGAVAGGLLALLIRLFAKKRR